MALAETIRETPFGVAERVVVRIGYPPRDPCESCGHAPWTHHVRIGWGRDAVFYVCDDCAELAR